MEATTREINSILANGRGMNERPWRRLATDGLGAWNFCRIGTARIVVFTHNSSSFVYSVQHAVADAQEIMREKGYTNRMWVTPCGYLKVQCDME